MNFVQAFQEMKRIHGFCPCCGDVFRLSDATIFTKGAPPSTPFDKVDQEQAKVQRAVDRFDEREQEIREHATALGQKAARKKLKCIAGYFVERGVDPQDVKTLFHPVDYVVFRGLNGKKVTGIELVDRPPVTGAREKLQKTIRGALKAGNVEWRTWRIDADAGRVEEEGG